MPSPRLSKLSPSTCIQAAEEFSAAFLFSTISFHDLMGHNGRKRWLLFLQWSKLALSKEKQLKLFEF
jgi:hypothetical protein